MPGYGLAIILLQKFPVALEINIACPRRITGIFGCQLQTVLGTQAVADIDIALHETHMLVDEIPVHPVILDNVALDIVEDRQVRLGGEDDWLIGKLEGAMFKGG